MISFQNALIEKLCSLRNYLCQPIYLFLLEPYFMPLLIYVH